MFKHPPIPQWKEMLLGDQKSKLVPRQKDLVRRVGAFTQYIGFKLLRVTFCLTTRHSNWSSALSFLNGTAKATYFGLGYHRNMGHYRKVSQLNSRCYVKSMNFSCRMKLLNKCRNENWKSHSSRCVGSPYHVFSRRLGLSANRYNRSSIYQKK